MNLLDLFIVVIAASAALRGLRLGLFRQAGSFVGFVGGLVVGAAAARFVLPGIAGSGGRSFVAALCIFGSAWLIAEIGEAVGTRISGALHHIRLGWADMAFGGLAGLVAVLVSAWLLAPMANGLPVPGLDDELASSRVVRSLDAQLPPVPAVIARVERLLDADGFPRAFVGLDPQLSPVAGPTTPEVEAAVAAAGRSVVQIEGAGCGGVVAGSGFVVANDAVVTNAHVVAGVSRPVVLAGDRVLEARITLFDPDLDVAVLKVSGLGLPVLPVELKPSERGTAAVALGYPNGGPFTAVPAAVQERVQAVGRNIYDDRIVSRDVYALQADVEPGNSGGPVVLPDGRIIGIVFAKSESTVDTGYALVIGPAWPEISGAAASNQRVPTGRCVQR